MLLEEIRIPTVAVGSLSPYWGQISFSHLRWWRISSINSNYIDLLISELAICTLCSEKRVFLINHWRLIEKGWLPRRRQSFPNNAESVPGSGRRENSETLLHSSGKIARKTKKKHSPWQHHPWFLESFRWIPSMAPWHYMIEITSWYFHPNPQGGGAWNKTNSDAFHSW